MEVNIAIMNNFQSSFSFLFLDAKNRSKEIDFLAFYCSPPFYFLPFQASLILAVTVTKLHSCFLLLSFTLEILHRMGFFGFGFFFPRVGKGKFKRKYA